MDEEVLAKVRGNAAAKGLLEGLADALEAAGEWSAEQVKQVLAAVAAAAGVKPGQLMFPLRVALSGRPHGPDLGAVMEVLGRERGVARVRALAGML
jgi:glutamyl-tRNA synthetase